MTLFLIGLSFAFGMATGMFVVGLMIRNIASRNGGRYTFYLNSQRLDSVPEMAQTLRFASRSTE